MPTTNRPFFANFFAAFRAHSALQKSASPQPNSAAAASTAASGPSQSSSTSNPQTPSNPRSIHTKANAPQTQATSSATGAAMMQAASQHFANAAAAQARTLPRSPPPSGSPYSPPATPFARSRTPSATRAGRDRRGSDSSSDVSMSPAFRGLPGADVLRAEKWYIGGRTGTGEERFYKLGMVKRYRSQDRLSLDRISL